MQKIGSDCFLCWPAVSSKQSWLWTAGCWFYCLPQGKEVQPDCVTWPVLSGSRVLLQLMCIAGAVSIATPDPGKSGKARECGSSQLYPASPGHNQMQWRAGNPLCERGNGHPWLFDNWPDRWFDLPLAPILCGMRTKCRPTTTLTRPL